MNSSNEQEAARQEVVEVASALVHGTLPFLEGVRRLASARFGIPEAENEADLLLFTGIDSQSDHIPIGEARSLCTDQWLRQCDEEVQKLEASYKQEIMAACARITKRFANAA